MEKLTVSIDFESAQTADQFAALLEAIAREMREDWTPDAKDEPGVMQVQGLNVRSANRIVAHLLEKGLIP